MQDIKCKIKEENSPTKKKSENFQEFSHISTQISPILNEKNKTHNNFIGKKLSGDAELILWLSGVEMNNKNEKEDEGFEEINSKIKKKLRNKLIKNAKKCELYFIQKYPGEECINIQCDYCLKRNFNHNELIRFVNFDDFMYYLKYIFYLSDKVICYSINSFKSNKKNFDSIFSKFNKKEEKWEFDQEKIICKQCMLKLINKPNFIEKIKSIFLNKENEKSYNINYGDIIIELNSDKNSKCENKNDENEKLNFVVEKYSNNSKNKKHKTINDNIKINNMNISNYNYYNNRSFDSFNKYNNPNYLNIYNSNNINININLKRDNKIINSYLDNNEYNSLFYFYNEIKNRNNNINNLIPNEPNSYWQQLIFCNHYKILNLCQELKNEINNFKNFINHINAENDDMEKKEKNNNKFFQNFIEKSKDKTLLLLKEIGNCIAINHNYINEFLNVIFNIENDYKNNSSQLIKLIYDNNYNITYIHKIYFLYNDIVNLYLYKIKSSMK